MTAALKRWPAVALAAVLAVALATCSSDSRIEPAGPGRVAHEAEHTEFADAGLESAVRAALAAPRGPLADSQLASIRRLEAVQVEIADLRGVERMPNIAVLMVAANRIRDVSPLTALIDLEILDLSNNRVQDIDGLAGLRQLRELNLDDNQVQDLTPLSGLTGLILLNVTFNFVEQIEVLVRLLNLESVELAGNPLSAAALDRDLVLLQEAGVQTDFYEPFITFVDRQLEEVVRRTLGKPDIALTKDDLLTITNLRGAGQNIANLTGIEALANLESLNLAINKIVDMSPVSRLTGLTDLSLTTNPLTDLSPLASLTALEKLRFNATSVDDVSFLSDMVRLNRLEMEGNGIIDLSPLANLRQMEALRISNNDIVDISP